MKTFKGQPIITESIPLKEGQIYELLIHHSLVRIIQIVTGLHNVPQSCNVEFESGQITNLP